MELQYQELPETDSAIAAVSIFLKSWGLTVVSLIHA